MYHLASRGLKVIGIDRFAPPHDQGSSHGETRIIRKAYFEHPDYVPLLHQAWNLWDELAANSGKQLIQKRDLVFSGHANSEVTNGVRHSSQLHNLPLEILTPVDAMQRYPMFRIPADHTVTVEKTAGFLWVEQCIAAHLESAMSHGARLHTNEVVQAIDGAATHVTVQTNQSSYSAAAAVITCGAWTSEVLPEYSCLISIKRKTLFWHPIKPALWANQNQAPMFFFDLPEGQFYGVPGADGHTIKVGEHTGGELVQDPSRLVRDIQSADHRPVQHFVAHHLEDVEKDFDRAAVCLYSMSPDGHFLFNRISDLPIVAAGGFSGHGFKFTSVLGQAAADLIQHVPTSLDLRFLSAERFTNPGTNSVTQ